jgi:hypothetical protein
VDSLQSQHCSYKVAIQRLNGSGESSFIHSSESITKHFNITPAAVTGCKPPGEPPTSTPQQTGVRAKQLHGTQHTRLQALRVLL